jgi:hypothetical protein
MDFSDLSSFLPNIESLAIIYGWTFFAAAMFALGERIVAHVRARRAQAGDGPAGTSSDAAS